MAKHKSKKKKHSELKVVPPSKGAKVFAIPAHNVISIQNGNLIEYIYE